MFIEDRATRDERAASNSGANRMNKESPMQHAGLALGLLAIEMWLVPHRVAPAARPATDDRPTTAWVEESSPAVLRPKEQIACPPNQTFAGIIVLSSALVHPCWSEPDAECVLPPSITPPIACTVTTHTAVAVVAVMFVDACGQSVRFGYGLRSEIEVSLSAPAPHCFRSSAFQLAEETASAGSALAGAEWLNSRLEQAAAVRVPSTGYYGDCLSECLANSHAILWDLFMRCAEAAGVIGALTGGACALACVLTGPGWAVCVAACVAVLGAPTLMLLGTCLATYIAGMTVAVPMCTIGCLW